MLSALIALAQAVVAVPAISPDSGPLSQPADPARLTLVVADTVTQTDPEPLCDRPDCTSLFLGKFRRAVVLAGLPMPEAFTARLEMGSPYNMPYRLAFIVEQRDGMQPLIRAQAGFHYKTKLACFEPRDMRAVAWQPTGERISIANGELCVRE